MSDRDPRMDPAEGDWFTGPDGGVYVHVDHVANGVVYYARCTATSPTSDLRRKPLDDWRASAVASGARAMTAAEVDAARREAGAR